MRTQNQPNNPEIKLTAKCQ